MRYMQSLFVIASLFLAGIASAQVEITEIMYDLEGSDTGKEWLEVYNSGTEPVDLSTWRFVEADTNHKLSVVSGDGTLEAGGFALIIDDTNPGFTGDVFKSSFSLSNTGEKIGLRDEALTDVDMVTYSSDMGAAGDGASLQKIGGALKASTPTPGIVNVFLAVPKKVEDTPVPPPSSKTSSSQTTTHGAPSPIATAPLSQTTALTPSLTISMGSKEKIVLAGMSVVFEATARGASGEGVQSAQYVWNFGDGTTGEGKRIEHVYDYAGDYAVVLDVTAGSYNAVDRSKVTVVPADVRVARVGDAQDFFVEIANDTSYEVDLSGWMLRAGDKTFAFPKGTFLFPKKTLMVGQRTTELLPASSVALLYPNGKEVSSYGSSSLVHAIGFETIGNHLAFQDVVDNEVAESRTNTFVASIAKTAEIASASEIENDNVRGDIIQGNIAQMTSGLPVQRSEDGLFWGLIGVALLVLIAIYAVLDRKPIDTTPGIKSEADLYKVIEIEE